MVLGQERRSYQNEIDVSWEIKKLKQWLERVHRSLNYTPLYQCEMRPEGDGKILFRSPPRLPFLIFDVDAGEGIYIVDNADIRLKSIEYTKKHHTVTVDLSINGIRKTLYYGHSLIPGLSFLFYPEVLREYNIGRVEIRDESFEDFIGIVVDYGATMASEGKIDTVSFDELFPEFYYPYVVYMKSYPGINFEFIGIRHEDDRSLIAKRVCLEAYTLKKDAILERVLRIVLFDSKERDDEYNGLAYRLVRDTPAFKEIYASIRNRVPRIIDMYKKILKTTYFGLRAYEF